jgi:RimJ/RimL family protein N-acetyltransferase
LDDLIDNFDNIEYKGRKLKDVKYVVVGQLCLAKGYRGMGLVPSMYNFYRDSLRDKYECCLTEVDDKNLRSLQAHLKCGFQIVQTVHHENGIWYFILWDWSSS